jgi:hypothetical protein
MEGTKVADSLLIHLGGSNRKLDKQIQAFKAANITIDLVGSTGIGHHSNHNAIMPDTMAARELLKKVGGTIRREQWAHLKKSTQERML